MENSVKRNVIRLLHYIQRLKWFKHSNDGVSQADTGRRLGFPPTNVNNVIKNKQNILADVKSASPVNTAIIRKMDSLVADMEKLLMVTTDDQTNHHVPIN